MCAFKEAHAGGSRSHRQRGEVSERLARAQCLGQHMQSIWGGTCAASSKRISTGDALAAFRCACRLGIYPHLPHHISEHIGRCRQGGRTGAIEEVIAVASDDAVVVLKRWLVVSEMALARHNQSRVL